VLRRLIFRISALTLCLSAPPAASAAFWHDPQPLGPDEVFALKPGGVVRETIAAAQSENLLVVDLGDGWVPYLFSESDGPADEVKPNPYRETFITLANDRTSPDEIFLESPAGRSAVLSTVPVSLRSDDPKQLSADELRALDRARSALAAERVPNFLEVYGIPPTLSVLARRIAADSGKACYATVDLPAIQALDFEISFQTRDQARADYDQANEDATWVAERLVALGADPGQLTPQDAIARIGTASAASVTSVAAASSAATAPVVTAPADSVSAVTAAGVDIVDAPRLERYRRGQVRLGAVHAVQDRLTCEGLLTADRITPGMYDLYTHRALAEFERKNDVFGWGFVSGETKDALVRPPLELYLETFRRILAERVSDIAGTIEDGSVSRGEEPVTYADAAGNRYPVTNLVGDFVDRLVEAMGIHTADDLLAFLGAIETRGFENLRVAYQAPPLPPYYGSEMDLAAEIDRGDVWYDVPLDSAGRPLAQRRRRYPTFTLYASWLGQKIPLVHWRTTIGSWRSELGGDGHVYLKYKNSDVGPRIWKNIVAAPVWVPPSSTPGRDLVTRKVFDRHQGPVTVVNTEVMGPGYSSAYGLVMAIHLKQLPEGGLHDNLIRTHGSVDYTSIARRFSHGCHRLVNNRAVRLFDFVLRHRPHVRQGNHRLGADFRRRFWHQGRTFEYRLATRGYYYELRPPIPITVLEGRILGNAKAPIRSMVRKPGVDYGPPPADNPIEPQPVPGP